MDLTATAQAADAVVAITPYHATWLAALLGVLFGWAVPKAIAKDPNLGAQLKSAAGAGAKLLPDAAVVATLAGQPALAGGLEAASKIAQSLTTTTDPAQLQALVQVHAQTLAAAGAPPVAA
jgi:hypothetical protein